MSISIQISSFHILGHYWPAPSSKIVSCRSDVLDARLPTSSVAYNLCVSEVVPRPLLKHDLHIYSCHMGALE